MYDQIRSSPSSRRRSTRQFIELTDHNTEHPAAKAKMAQRIVRTASEGITDLEALTSVAVDEAREPAA
jgi:hypothetical protein